MKKNKDLKLVFLVCPECGRSIEVIEGSEVVCIGNIMGIEHNAKKMIIYNNKISGKK